MEGSLEPRSSKLQTNTYSTTLPFFIKRRIFLGRWVVGREIVFVGKIEKGACKTSMSYYLLGKQGMGEMDNGVP